MQFLSYDRPHKYDTSGKDHFPGRLYRAIQRFPRVDTIRKLAEKDLNQAVLSAYNSTIKHLIDQDAYIYDLTFLGRNDMVLLIDGENDTAR